MQNVEIITKAKDLVSKGWNKTHFATDKNGDMRSYWDSRARSFCLYGAFLRVGHDENIDVLPALKIVNEKLKMFGGMGNWNDSPKVDQEAVINILDEVILELN